MTAPARTLTAADFVLARVAEDEAAAQAAMTLASTPWRATYGRQVETSRDGYLVTPEDEHSRSDEPPDDVAAHIARHDPARVLAQCAALRSVVALHAPIFITEGLRTCAACVGNQPGTLALHPCPTLRAFASIWRDHGAFDPAWSAS